MQARHLCTIIKLMRLRNVFKLLIIIAVFSSFCSCQKIKSTMKFTEAETAYNQGNFDRALEIYLELVEMSPSDASLYWHLGTVYFSKGDKAGVQKQIKVLRKLGRGDLADDLAHLLEK